MNVPQPVSITDPEMAARLDCVNHLAALLPSLLSHTQGSVSQAHQQGKHVQLAGQQFALAEDWQLRGFLPLQQCHEKLVFEKPEAAQVTAGLLQAELQLQSQGLWAVHLTQLVLLFIGQESSKPFIMLHAFVLCCNARQAQHRKPIAVPLL